MCCLLYTSDAADERSSVDLGGRRILKKKNSVWRGGLRDGDAQVVQGMRGCESTEEYKSVEDTER